MGNIKQVYITRVAKELLREHPEEFSTDYESNKKKIGEYCVVKSKSTRNKIAGFIAQYLKQTTKGSKAS